MEVIVEILEQGQRKPRIERINTNGFSIGRSWDADIIIQDVEIDAEHLWVGLDDNEINGTEKSKAQPEYAFVSDCDTVNGSKLGQAFLKQDHPVRWGQSITIGSTKICLHNVLSPVVAAKKRTAIDLFVSKLQIGWIALGLMALAILNAQFSEHLSRPINFTWEAAIDSGVQLLATLLCWAVVWGSITRLTKHQFQIWLHLSLASLALISMSLLTEASSVIVFNTLSSLWATWSSTVILLITGISWVLFILYVGTNLGLKKRLGITTTLIFFYLLTTQVLPQMRSENWVATPQLVTIAKPASLLIATESTQQDYLFNIETTFDRVDVKAFNEREKLD